MPACLTLTKLEFPVDAVNKKLKLIYPGVVAAANPTGVADFLILCHANYRAKRDGDELQRELDDFLRLELVMCPWLPVKPNPRPGLKCSKALPWASKTSRWASIKFILIYLAHIHVDALKIFTVQTLCVFSLLCFPPGIKKISP